MSPRTFPRASGIARAIGGLGCAAVLVGLVWLAAAPASAPVQAAQVTAVDRCDRIDDLEASTLAALDLRLTTFRARRAAVLEAQRARWATQDERREAELAAIKRRLAQKLDGLTPTTEEQRQAIAAFRAAIDAALTTRQAAFGAAIREYRAGVVRTVDDLIDETLTIFARHRDVVVGHLRQARADCAAGVPPRTVIETLQANLAAARAALDAALAARPGLHERLVPLEEALRLALAEARAAFRAAVHAAAAELRAAFANQSAR